MDSMEENIYDFCRVCNGTGIELYYFPVNVKGRCSHCGGDGMLDWVTNIIGISREISKPTLSEGQKHDLRIFEKYSKEYGRDVMIQMVRDHTFWRFVFQKESEEREAKRRKWKEEYGRLLETSKGTTERV